MAINERLITMVGQWAKNAQTNIPMPPVPGISYRNVTLARADIEGGQAYDKVYDSARHNQMKFLATGLVQQIEQYGILPWSSLTNYPAQGITLGLDGTLYSAIQPSGTDTDAGPQPTSNAEYWKNTIPQPEEFWLLKRLTAPLTIHVATTGSDATADGTPDAPFRSIQTAVNYVASTFFLAQYNVTIQVAAGTYLESVKLPAYMATSGKVVITGAGIATIVAPSGFAPDGFQLMKAVTYNLENMQINGGNSGISDTNRSCVYCSAGSLILSGCTFLVSSGDGGAAANPITCTSGGNIGFWNTNAITMTAASVGSLILSNGGSIGINGPLTVTGTVTGGTVSSNYCGQITRGASQPPISGAVTGPRYIATRLGVIDSNGGGVNYFPGTSAGSLSTGAQYV